MEDCDADFEPKSNAGFIMPGKAADEETAADWLTLTEDSLSGLTAGFGKSVVLPDGAEDAGAPKVKLEVRLLLPGRPD